MRKNLYKVELLLKKKKKEVTIAFNVVVNGVRVVTLLGRRFFRAYYNIYIYNVIKSYTFESSAL